MVDNNLVLLTLDLGMEDAWECELADRFDSSSFVIENGHPVSGNSFAGLMRIEGGDIGRVKRFLNKREIPIRLKDFDKEARVFHFRDENAILSAPLINVDCSLEWPVRLNGDFKRLRVLLGESDVDDLVAGVEDCGVDVLKMSKIRRGVEFGDLFTLKQREILEPTIELGYYDFPRKISLNNLSKQVGVSPSTLCVHLQKIESRVFGSDLRFF
jgi:DNA-binding Lrp family transcriptional regulator